MPVSSMKTRRGGGGGVPGVWARFWARKRGGGGPPPPASPRHARRASATSSRSCSAALSAFSCGPGRAPSGPGTGPRGCAGPRCGPPAGRRTRRASRPRRPPASCPRGAASARGAPLAGGLEPARERPLADPVGPRDLGLAALAGLVGRERPLAQVAGVGTRHRSSPVGVKVTSTADRGPGSVDERAIRSSTASAGGESDKCGGIRMDSLITAAARALAAGDPLGALNRVALRDDAPALALRGIAMARLGDLVRAKALLRSAARAFGPREAVARARCVVAEAEIALVSRDLGWPAKALDAARATLEEHGDRGNAAHARYLQIRRLLLIGRIDDAERSLAGLDAAISTPVLRTVHQLAVAAIAIRRVQTKSAADALAQAMRAARDARIPALLAEVESASGALTTPAARLVASGEERLLR